MTGHRWRQRQPWLTGRGNAFDSSGEAPRTSLQANSRLIACATCGNVANLHVIMGIRNCEFFEVLLPSESHQYGLVEDIRIDGKGRAAAPTAPGLGVEIDHDLIRVKEVARLS